MVTVAGSARARGFERIRCSSAAAPSGDRTKGAAAISGASGPFVTSVAKPRPRAMASASSRPAPRKAGLGCMRPSRSAPAGDAGRGVDQLAAAMAASRRSRISGSGRLDSVSPPSTKLGVARTSSAAAFAS